MPKKNYSHSIPLRLKFKYIQYNANLFLLNTSTSKIKNILPLHCRINIYLLFSLERFNKQSNSSIDMNNTVYNKVIQNFCSLFNVTVYELP